MIRTVLIILTIKVTLCLSFSDSLKLNLYLFVIFFMISLHQTASADQ